MQTRNRFEGTRSEVESLMKKMKENPHEHKNISPFTMEGYLYVQEKREYLYGYFIKNFLHYLLEWTLKLLFQSRKWMTDAISQNIWKSQRYFYQRQLDFQESPIAFCKKHLWDNHENFHRQLLETVAPYRNSYSSIFFSLFQLFLMKIKITGTKYYYTFLMTASITHFTVCTVKSRVTIFKTV